MFRDFFGKLKKGKEVRVTRSRQKPRSNHPQGQYTGANHSSKSQSPPRRPSMRKNFKFGNSTPKNEGSQQFFRAKTSSQLRNKVKQQTNLAFQVITKAKKLEQLKGDQTIGSFRQSKISTDSTLEGASKNVYKSHTPNFSRKRNIATNGTAYSTRTKRGEQEEQGQHRQHGQRGQRAERVVHTVHGQRSRGGHSPGGRLPKKKGDGYRNYYKKKTRLKSAKQATDTEKQTSTTANTRQYKTNQQFIEAVKLNNLKLAQSLLDKSKPKDQQADINFTVENN